MANINIVIPCSGSGQRFVDAGYQIIKPLIPINGVPLIKRVVDSIGIDANYIFCILKSHDEKFGFAEILRTIKPNCTIIYVDKKTEGAASTVLLTKDLIDNQTPLAIANCDQIFDLFRPEFIGNTIFYDGCNLYFEANDPCWSYIKIDKNRFITKVAEKLVISKFANCGLYSYKSGALFVKYAEQMIKKNIRVNNEFYISLVYAEMIADGLKIKAQKAWNMMPAGIPSQLEYTEKLIKFRESN